MNKSSQKTTALSGLTKAELIERVETLEGQLAAREDKPQESAQALENHHLIGILEQLTDGFVFYDKDDLLVFCNSAYRDAMEDVSDILEPGLAYEEFHRTRAERAQRRDGFERDEAWIQERLEAHRNPKGPLVRRFDDGRTFHLSEYKLQDGGTVTVRKDVTDLINAEEVLLNAQSDLARKVEERTRELAETESLFRSAIGSLQEAFALYNQDNRLVYWNSTWLRLQEKFFPKDEQGNLKNIIRVGMHYEEIVRMHVEGEHIPEAIGRVEEYIAERIARRENPSGEILLHYADDSWFVVKEARTNDGGYVATYNDVTTLKQTEARVSESEARLHQLVDALDGAFALFGPDDRLVMWNEKWQERHWAIKDIVRVGMSFTEQTHGMIKAGMQLGAIGREEAWLAERLEAHKNPGAPIVREDANGRWHIIKESRTEEGGILSLQTDITDLKRAEEASNQSHNMLSACIESLEEGFALYDADDKLLIVNEAFKRLQPAPREIIKPGMQFEELLRANVASGLFPEAAEDQEAFIQDALKLHREPQGPAMRRMENGVWYMRNKIRLPDGGCAITLTDVTALKEREEELARSNTALEQFAYVTSHDLRSPLRGIDMTARWVEKDLEGTESPEIKENLALMRSRISRMDKLMEALLAYSRIQTKKVEPDLVNVGELVDDIRILMRPQEGFEVVTKTKMPVFRTAGIHLQQVLQNLVDNAIKHHDRETGRVEITAIEGDELVEFTVGDDGPGIPEQYHDKIFQIFQTLKPKDDKSGAGMGLTMVKQLVETNGGQISIDDNEDERGVTFRFTWKKKGGRTC